MVRVYLDYNATAPLRAEARAAMGAAMEVVGNPSSVHAEGRAAKAVVERARAQVAAAVGCQPGEVVFTSGATEAAGVLAGLRADVARTAHDALWAHQVAAGDGGAAIGLANSETGVISEPPERARLLDVTQAIGRMPFAFSWSGAEFAILSAHKIGGPKGVGALIIRDGVDIAPLQEGGGQEMGRRSGTENVIGIAGFGAAAEAAARDLEAGVWERVAEFRNILENTIEARAKNTIFVGKEMRRLPNTSCMITPGWKGETQVMAMDLAGYAISSGSACSSGKVRASRVLRAMGFDETQAACAIRVSLGPETTEAEVRGFAETWLAAKNKFEARAG